MQGKSGSFLISSGGVLYAHSTICSKLALFEASAMGCGIESSSSMFSATDIASFLACRHTATLARAESKNEIAKPFFHNQTIDLLRRLGLEHEQQYLRELGEKGGLSIARITIGGNWKDAVAETVLALRQGVDAVYQGTFLDAPWGGRSDFLVRVATDLLSYISGSVEVVGARLGVAHSEATLIIENRWREVTAAHAKIEDRRRGGNGNTKDAKRIHVEAKRR
jgi:hypothetical protein